MEYVIEWIIKIIASFFADRPNYVSSPYNEFDDIYERHLNQSSVVSPSDDPSYDSDATYWSESEGNDADELNELNEPNDLNAQVFDGEALGENQVNEQIAQVIDEEEAFNEDQALLWYAQNFPVMDYEDDDDDEEALPRPNQEHERRRGV